MSAIAAMGHFFESWKVLFTPAARIVQFDAVIVADEGHVIGIEEGSVICELRKLVAIAKTSRLMSNIAGENQSFSGSQWLVEGVDGIHVTRCGANQMERTIEMHVADRLFLIREMNLRDRLHGLVLQRH